jgi:hypothetical protein
MRLLILLVTAFLLAPSCSKNRRAATKDPNPVEGGWELRKETGGLAGTINYAPGNKIQAFFEPGKTYRLTNPSGTVSEGTYEIQKPSAPQDWILTLHPATNGQAQVIKDSVRLTGLQLIFIPATSCCDIPTSYYDMIVEYN